MFSLFIVLSIFSIYCIIKSLACDQSKSLSLNDEWLDLLLLTCILLRLDIIHS